VESLRLLRLRLKDKLDEIEKLSETRLNYDALENPAQLLKHYKNELRFFGEGKRSLARMMDSAKDSKGQEDYEELRDFYQNAYPELEFNLLRIISVLEDKLKNT